MNAPNEPRLPAPDQALAVLGMPRCGSSLLAVALHRHGLQAPRTMMAPRRADPEGFWDARALATFADEVLESFGMEWHSLGRSPDFAPPGPLGEGGEDLSSRLGELLAEEFPGPAPMLVKSNRFCRLVPLLAAVCDASGTTLRFGIAFRHPWEAARSLEAHAGVSIERGLILWLDYYLEVERATRDRDRAFVSFDLLLSDWAVAVDRVSAHASATLEAGDPIMAQDLDQTVDPGLRNYHQNAEAWTFPEPLGPWLEEVYGALLALGNDPETSRASVLDRVREELDRFEALLIPVTRDLEGAARRERYERKAIEGHLRFAERRLRELESAPRDGDAGGDGSRADSPRGPLAALRRLWTTGRP